MAEGSSLGGGLRDASVSPSRECPLGRTSEMADPSVSRLLFLRQSADIERVKKLGRRRQTSLFTMLTYATGLPYTRVGIVVGKRFGLAVKRNRVKRIFRELARQRCRQLIKGQDVLFFPRRESLDVRHAVLSEAWARALQQEGVLMSSMDEGCDTSASR
jgi:ribonuclease P protein component